MLLTLGEFVFSAFGTPFEGLDRDTKWRVAAHDRVSERPLLQFVGPGADRITIDGKLHPQFTDGAEAIELLRSLADKGESLPLVDEYGWVYGLWAIEAVKEKKSAFVWGGPQTISFSVSLIRDDDTAVGNRVFLEA